MSTVASITEARELYTFDLRDRFSWHNFSTPEHDPRILRAIEAVAPPVYFQSNEYPRYRAVWGGSEQAYVEQTGDWPAGYYLKYQLCIVPDYRNPDNLLDSRNHVGWQWRKPSDGYFYFEPLTGQRKVVALLESVPAAIRMKGVDREGGYYEIWHRTKEQIGIPANVVVLPILREPEEIGLPRWILERFHLPEEAESGVAGYYCETFWQGETIDPYLGFGDYRPLDLRIIEIVQGLWKFERSSADEKRAYLLKKANEKAEAKDKREAALWDDRQIREEETMMLEEVEHILAVSTSEEDMMKRVRRLIEKNLGDQVAPSFANMGDD